MYWPFANWSCFSYPYNSDFFSTKMPKSRVLGLSLSFFLEFFNSWVFSPWVLFGRRPKKKGALNTTNKNLCCVLKRLAQRDHFNGTALTACHSLSVFSFIHCFVLESNNTQVCWLRYYHLFWNQRNRSTFNNSVKVLARFLSSEVETTATDYMVYPECKSKETPKPSDDLKQDQAVSKARQPR